MDIIEKQIEELIPYEFNNKIHDEVQINRIANSIKEFWFLQPVVIDQNNIIIVWHWRVEWAKKLWLKKVPCVQVTDLTEEQIKKYRILDNKLNESDYDLSNLKLELDQLWDLNIWDLQITTTELFPEFDAPDFNPDDYDENFWVQSGDNSCTLVVTVKDETELQLLKDDLKNLWYTNFK